MQSTLNPQPEPYRQRKPLSVWSIYGHVGKNTKIPKQTRKQQEAESKLKRIKSRYGYIYKCGCCRTIFNFKFYERVPGTCLFCWSFTGYKKKARLKKALNSVKAGICTQCLQWPCSTKNHIKKWNLCESCFNRMTRRKRKEKEINNGSIT